MARAGGAYVVRDDGAGTPGNVDKLYPYTLRGLTEALEEARFRSFAGPPQVVAGLGGRRHEGHPPLRARAGKPAAGRAARLTRQVPRSGDAARIQGQQPPERVRLTLASRPTALRGRAGLIVVVDQEGSSGVIEEIVPKAAACAESFGGSLGTGLFPEEEMLVARATEKRRQEFTAGRECARSALSALGVQAAPILRGYRGAPQWPDGIVGSIAHCAGYCAAAVARAQGPGHDRAGRGTERRPPRRRP